MAIFLESYIRCLRRSRVKCVPQEVSGNRYPR